MPRQPRLELPGVPVHVTQRGANRCAIFLDEPTVITADASCATPAASTASPSTPSR